MSKKKKKKKQASVDSTQLVKGGVVCAVVLGAIYFFSTLGGGGGAASNSTVALLAPQNNAQPNGGNVQPAPNPQPNLQPAADPTAPPETPEVIEQPPRPLNMVSNVGEAVPPEVPASGGTRITDEMNQIEIPADPLKLPDLIERVTPSVVRINFKRSGRSNVGTGFIVSQSGLVVTSLHAMEGIDRAYVEFSDGASASVLGYRIVNPQFNIAVLQIEPPEEGMKILPLTDQVPVKGSQIVTFGAPPFSASEGTVDAVLTQNEVHSVMRLPFNGNWLQTSTPFLPATSGGPVVNRYGQVVAVNMIQLTNGENKNIALAAKDILQFINSADKQQVNKLAPDLFQGLNTDLKRKTAKDITETDRGAELFAAVKEIGFSQIYPSDFDPTGIVRNTVTVYAKQTIQKSDIDFSIENFDQDVPVMFVTVSAVTQRVRSRESLKVSIHAALIGIDPDADSSNKYVILWKGEETEIGTLLPEAISPKVISRAFGPRLTKFFGKVRTAYSKAKRIVK